jgi:hypothetical protein
VSISDRDIVWSPDSARLAFTEDALVTARDGDLWVMETSSGDLINLTDDGFEGSLSFDAESADAPVHVDLAPAWTPDSESLTISRTAVVNSEPAGTEIVEVDVASGAVAPLTPVSMEQYAVYQGMSWSPDGNRLYYSVGLPDPDAPDNGVWEFDRSTGESRQLFTTDPDRGSPVLAEIAATGELGLIVYPQYYVSGRGSGDAIVLGELASGEVTTVDGTSSTTDDSARSRTATFAANGTEVLFTVRDGEVARLQLRRLPDGKAAEVAASSEWLPAMNAPGNGLDWAGDGTVFGTDGIDNGILLHIDQPTG